MQSDATPLVSVIVTTKNSARTLDRCLAGIREQTHPRLELIVVDNSSTDDTFAIAQRHAECFSEMLKFGWTESVHINMGIFLSNVAQKIEVPFKS